MGIDDDDDDEMGTSPDGTSPDAPRFLMSQPSASQQQTNQSEWDVCFEQRRTSEASGAVAFNNAQDKALPDGLFPNQQQQPPVRLIEVPNQGPAKKTKRDPPKDLPPELLGFRFEHRHRLHCEEELDTRNKTDPGPHKVAKCIIAGQDEKEKKWILDDLTSAQLRKLMINFGCKGAGTKTKFQCRQHVALCVDGGTLYQNTNIPNPTSSSQEKKLNTLMRFLNAAFSPSMVDRLIHLNDTKGRKDCEEASGGSPVKTFFTDLSELVNDALNDEELKQVVNSECDENARLFTFVEDGIFNLCDCVQQTFKTVQQNLCDVMKARERCRRASTASGHHDNDLWGWCTNEHFTEARKGHAVPAAAVHCCDILCRKFPDIDGSFAEALTKTLKSDSTMTPVGDANSGGRSIGSGKSTSGKSSVASTLQECFDGIEERQDAAATQRQALIDVQLNKAKADKERGDWKEHHELLIKFLEHKKDFDAVALRNLVGLRIQVLEKKLKIPVEQSVTKGTTVPGGCN